MSDRKIIDTRVKILAREDLRVRLYAHRQNRERIVLANGCFDVLHVGHARYLDGAKREGDVLVVAVNSDAIVRQLKGEGRPILPQKARAELVAAFAVVDYVIIFDESSVEALLTALRPDVHAKGTDYTQETVPERELAAELGIRVAIVGDPKEHSTLGLLSRVRDSNPGTHDG
jgi:rfaE bifunctional protein nucleotidyltransferase chain/domain